MIDLQIKHADDTKEEKQVTDSLEDLVNGHMNSLTAAVTIETAITTALLKNADESFGGWQHYIWDCLGRAGMAIPSEHHGQDRLVGLLQALQRLPAGNAQWSLNRSNRYRGFEQWMWELDQGYFIGGRQVERSQDVAVRYINFSAFLARLLAAGMVEATRLSALINAPFTSNPLVSGTYPDPAEAAGHYAPYAQAASHWILYAGEALYEMCEKETLTEIGKQKWTPGLWAAWKVKFASIAAADRFDAHTRRLTSSTVERIVQIERAGVVSNPVDTFGFISMQDEEDD